MTWLWLVLIGATVMLGGYALFDALMKREKGFLGGAAVGLWKLVMVVLGAGIILAGIITGLVG